MTPPTDSGFGRLEQNDEMQAQQIATLTEGVEDLRSTVADLKAKAVDMQGRQINMEGVLSRNTEVTEALLVIAEGFKGLSRGLSWIGRKSKPVLAWIAAATAAFMGLLATWQSVKAWFR
jgi:hypothetical protein